MDWKKCPTPWPPRSPDITSLDFFLWGYVKNRVYRTPVRDVETLQSRIIEVLAEVGDAQNSLQVLQVALRSMPVFSALAQFALSSMPFFFSTCAICVCESVNLIFIAL